MKLLKWIFILIVAAFSIFFITEAINAGQCMLINQVPVNRYFWMFDSNVIKDLSIENTSANIKKSKFHFSYNYKNLYRYLIIEDSKFDNISLNEIKYLTTDIDKSNRYIASSEGFETWEVKHMSLTTNLCTNLSKKLIIFFDKKANISQHNLTNSITLEGTFESVLFKNENKKNQYLIKYDSLATNAILFYKPKDRLYIIIVTPFTDQIGIQNGIAILKLY